MMPIENMKSAGLVYKRLKVFYAFCPYWFRGKKILFREHALKKKKKLTKKPPYKSSNSVCTTKRL